MIFLLRLSGTIIEKDSLFNPLYHSGDNEFIQHLIDSENLCEQTIDGQWLFRPEDYLYAENWVMKCGHVPRANKPRLQHTIRRMARENNLWFSMQKG